MDLEIELLKIKTSIEITLLKIELFFVNLKLYIHDNLKPQKALIDDNQVSKKVLVK